MNHLPDEPNADQPTQSEQAKVRRAKRQAMIDADISPYPVTVPLTSTIAEVRAQFGHLETGQETDHVVGLAGRVVFVRNTGKLCFAMLQAGAGERLQAMVSLAEVGEESLDRFKALVDLGDHLFVQGRVISSKRGELSILVGQWQIASKALRPLPVLHSELSDESRIRDRSADLIVRQTARDVARQRSTLIRSLRESMYRRGYLEIETPVLQTVHGGAAARPFTTHINAYDIDLFLRIAPELFLKRAMVGGMDQVFEIGKVFRNEGADSSHSPEFTTIEAYQAYGDYNTMAELTQGIIQEAAIAVHGTAHITRHDGSTYDLSGQWDSIDLYESVSQAVAQELDYQTSSRTLQQLADNHNLSYDPKRASAGKMIELLFEELVVPSLAKPTFVMNFPVETSPLTRQHRSRPGVVEKWDLYVDRLELATAYSELVDPVIQRERLVAQAALGAAGDDEAMALDEDFLGSIEYGMPPAGGMGMGVDRLAMVLTGLGIRDTTLFPIVKPLT